MVSYFARLARFGHLLLHLERGRALGGVGPDKMTKQLGLLQQKLEPFLRLAWKMAKYFSFGTSKETLKSLLVPFASSCRAGVLEDEGVVLDASDELEFSSISTSMVKTDRSGCGKIDTNSEKCDKACIVFSFSIS